VLNTRQSATRDHTAGARVVAAIQAHEPWLAGMDEEHNDPAIGFVPDAYATVEHHCLPPAACRLPPIAGSR
jgi:hypothetical protein